eukprot:1553151-Prymnesium_polylepis.1
MSLQQRSRSAECSLPCFTRVSRLCVTHTHNTRPRVCRMRPACVSPTGQSGDTCRPVMIDGAPTSLRTGSINKFQQNYPWPPLKCFCE